MMFGYIIIIITIYEGFCKIPTDFEIKYVRSGEDVFLDCPIHYPDSAKTIDVRWRRKQWTGTIYAHSQESSDRQYIAPNYEGRILRADGAALKLLNVNSSDQDLFICEVSFNFDKIALPKKYAANQQISILLIVNEKPKIIDITPKKLVVNPGENVSLFCKVRGQPLPTVLWYKQNAILTKLFAHETDNRKLYFTGNVDEQFQMISKESITVRTYNISNADFDDSGDYRCVANNSEGMESETVHLIVKGSIYFTERPTNKIVQVGESLEINCRATGDPNNITYHWFKNFQSVGMILSLEGRFAILKSGSLRIISIKPYDSGEYMCIPSNGMKYKFAYRSENLKNLTGNLLQDLKATIFAAANITVYYKPIPFTIDHSIYLAMNSRGYIPCVLIANPAVKQIYWKKEGSSSEIHRRTGDLKSKMSVDASTNYTLTTYFHEWDIVSKVDSGSYRCRGFNLMGSGDWSPIFEIIVKESPYFTSRPASIYRVTTGQSILIKCKADGDPTPEVTWLQENGSRIPDTWLSVRDKGSIVVPAASKQHESTYFCKVENKVKTIVTRTKIIVTNAIIDSTALNNITVTCMLFSATIYWIPHWHSNIYFVTDVLFKLMSQSEWEKRTVLSSAVSHQTIFGLLPDEEYQFSIYFKSQMHQSFMSSIVSCRTLGYREDLVRYLPIDDKSNIIFPAIVKQLGPNPDPPVSVSVNVTVDNKLLISWVPPGNTTWPPILYYRAEYCYITFQSPRFPNSIQASYSHPKLKWQQLNPVLFPQSNCIIPLSLIVNSMPVINGILFRVRSYALLSFSRPSHSVSVDRSLLEILIANENEKVDKERTISSQSKWWPIIFWSLIGLVFSSIIFLSALILMRKCRMSELFDNEVLAQNSFRDQNKNKCSSRNSFVSKNHISNSAKDNYILINNQKNFQITDTLNSKFQQSKLGIYVKMSDISRETSKVSENPNHNQGQADTLKECPVSSNSLVTKNSNYTFCPGVSNDYNLYCNCYTYSPTIVLRNPLQTQRINTLTEL